jgi:iron complex outermembrane receptor protein
MKLRISGLCLFLCATKVLAAGGGDLLAAAPSENDYFADLPVVLSVSRLAQPLDETPGAVTVIDRDMIRLSGARSVTELMRLVPGFQVSDSHEALAPALSYHGAFNSFPNEMQVLIDGRSVYGAFDIGSVAQGLQSVDLEDIERIEVLRGSNSAAYGARAFLGVINIETREPTATRGGVLQKRSGENGVDDYFARLGWGVGGSDFRVSASRRADAGLAGAAGGNRAANLNVRADLQPTPEYELEIRAGGSEQAEWIGLANSGGNLPRQVVSDLGYVQADWRRIISDDQDLLVSVSHGEERYADAFRFAGWPTFAGGPVLFAGVPVDFGGTARNDTIGLQHTLRARPELRIVWGGELRREGVRSRSLYGTDAELSTEFRRLYGNLEWRLAPSVVFNGGGMLENDSATGSSVAPRAMLNWHVVPGQTFRIGASKAYRPASIYERQVDTVYVGAPISTGPLGSLCDSTLHSPPTAWNAACFLPGASFVPRFGANTNTGSLRPESLLAKEIGYLGEFRSIGLVADVRAFHERVSDFIGRQNAATSTSSPALLANALASAGIRTGAYTNSTTPDFSIIGYEIQTQWVLWPGSRLLANYADIRVESPDVAFATAAPRRSSGIVWFQQLPQDYDVSLMLFQASSSPWVSSTDSATAPAWHRLDARIGKRFQVSGSRVEAAVVVQNIGSDYWDYPTTVNSSNGQVAGSYAQQFQRRAFFTLSLDF